MVAVDTSIPLHTPYWESKGNRPAKEMFPDSYTGDTVWTEWQCVFCGRRAYTGTTMADALFKIPLH